MDFDLPFLSTICEDFYANGVSSMDSGTRLLTGRPYGGLGILWRKSLGDKCDIVKFDDNRLLGIEVKLLNQGADIQLLFVNIYMPYDCPDNVDEYIQYLARINEIIVMHPTPYVYIIGDLNANTCTKNNGNNSVNSNFGKILIDFCEEENIVLADYDLLPKDTYTFVSSAHDTVSWLDHILSTSPGTDLVQGIQVNLDFISSDHLPISLQLNCETLHVKQLCSMTSNHRIDWSQTDCNSRNHYCHTSAHMLSNVVIDHEMLICRDVSCNNTEHKMSIDNMYQGIIKSLCDSSSHLLPNSNRSKAKYQPIPGWNEYVKAAHSEARDAFLVWQSNSKPRSGPICDIMKTTRARFKHSLRNCKANEDRARSDALANNLLKQDNMLFWKDVNKMNHVCTNVVASTIDGVTGENNIAKVWHDHYCKLLNSNNDTSNKEFVAAVIGNIVNTETEFSLFKPMDVEHVIDRLKSGKSAGTDSVQSEHFKYAHKKVAGLLSMLFNAMFIHNHLPPKFMETVIVPIIKDKKGNITDKNNYRPIAITSVTSKILEFLLLDRMRSQLSTTSNQFGFKNKHGTDMCVYTLKQVIEYYNQRSSPVYVCYLDASKAFDRINHWCLFKKLSTRTVDPILLRLLISWYCNQTFCVRWGNITSLFFTVSNGVRQGGIMSPILFNVYMDDLSHKLNKSRIGCSMNGTIINHLMYADDTCIIAPSPSALQELIHICSEYASSNFILFNANKTKYMCFKPKSLKNLYIPTLYLNSVPLTVVTRNKYLGVFIHEKLEDDDDIFRHVKSLYARGNMLINRFRACTHNVKVKLFRTFFTNVYGCHLWALYKQTTYRRVVVAYNNIYRKMFKVRRGDSMSAIYVQQNIDPVNVLIRKNVFGFKNRLFDSSNLLIKCIMSSHFYYNSRLCTKWFSILYHA